MVSRKRGRAEMEASSEPTTEHSLLTRLRNTWEFANLMQYIYIFGKAVKIDDDFEIEDLEIECLKPEPSEKLAEIGLAMLKLVSSHRGLTPDLFDEYTRRQYVAKAPTRNPFGTEEIPTPFAGFDVFTKLRVLVQLSRWTLLNPDRMREKMVATDGDQTQWRVEEIGYDQDERLYFVLDDNRLYRRTDPPPPPPPAPKPKANSKKGKALARAAKRRRVIRSTESPTVGNEDEEAEIKDEEDFPREGEDTFGGRKWECLAVTLPEFQNFTESIRKSRDPDEKILYRRLTEDVLPVIEKLAEHQQKKIARRERELANMQKLATAKRSSRLASRHEREKEEQVAAEAEKKRQFDLIAAKKDQERQKQLDEARQSRMMTREQRIKDREYKRLLHEEELEHLSEDSRKLEKGESRLSERRIKAEMERKKRELKELTEEDDWIFDCSVCGVHGENIDDGSHSVACEKCNVWQHSACLGISKAAAEKEDFHLVCSDCKRKLEDAQKPKIPALKFTIGSSSSPPTAKSTPVNQNGDHTKKRKSEGTPRSDGLPPMKKFKHVAIPPARPNGSSDATSWNDKAAMHQSLMNGPTLSPRGQIPQPRDSPASSPPPGLLSPSKTAVYRNGNARRSVSNGYTFHNNGPAAMTNGTQNSPPNTAHNSFTQPEPRMNSTSQQPQATPVSSQNTSDLNGTLQSNGNHIDANNSVYGNKNKVPSPLNNRPSMSPTSGHYSISTFSKTYTPKPTNGANGHNGYGNAQPASTPYTNPIPIKNMTSASPAPPNTHLMSDSSPVMQPPNTDAGQRQMAGISPVKQSSPRPSSRESLGHESLIPPERLQPTSTTFMLDTVPVKDH
ncbi:hypothetical protein MMC25_001739 [Agyrium rufum]|nr:hypothetical protein [Agyrium rufum]